MLTEANHLLAELIGRLPELEWKINRFSGFFSSHHLPKGLFRSPGELNGSTCITEIKADIQALSQQKNERSAVYLAEQIWGKVNVLVALCQLYNRKNKTEEKIFFGMEMLSTRQQWINDLEVNRQGLEDQHNALTKTLQHMLEHINPNPEAILQLKSELGEVERRLTLAKETLTRAIT